MLASETITLTANHPKLCLKMIFERQDDRWSHRLVAGENREKIWLRSHEGGEAQDWPPSPPLQEVSQHQLAAGTAVLAVGMAGNSHWSASFSVDAGEILVELACLSKSRPEFLGTQYAIDENVPIIHTNEDGMFLQSGNCRLEISPLSATNWSTYLKHENQNLTICPNELSKMQGLATRWGYRINLIDRE